MKRITAIAITLAAVLGCSYVGGTSAAVSNADICRGLSDMGGSIVDARDRGASLDDVTEIINGSELIPPLKQGMHRIAVMIYTHPSLKRHEVVANGFKGCIEGMSEKL